MSTVVYVTRRRGGTMFGGIIGAGIILLFVFLVIINDIKNED